MLLLSVLSEKTMKPQLILPFMLCPSCLIWQLLEKKGVTQWVHGTFKRRGGKAVAAATTTTGIPPEGCQQASHNGGPYSDFVLGYTVLLGQPKACQLDKGNYHCLCTDKREPTTMSVVEVSDTSTTHVVEVEFYLYTMYDSDKITSQQ